MAEASGHVDALQLPFSLINRDAADEIAWCDAHHTGVIVYSPVRSGLLTGAFTAERAAALPAGDWRSRDDGFSGARNPRQVDCWIGAPNVDLTPADITNIAAAVRRTGAGHGRI
jgi:aryl-alcohol dehydrogenase-like predicted oxidoreductase